MKATHKADKLAASSVIARQFDRRFDCFRAGVAQEDSSVFLKGCNLVQLFRQTNPRLMILV